jgi:hypothetical protein
LLGSSHALRTDGIVCVFKATPVFAACNEQSPKHDECQSLVVAATGAGSDSVLKGSGGQSYLACESVDFAVDDEQPLTSKATRAKALP